MNCGITDTSLGFTKNNLITLHLSLSCGVYIYYIYYYVQQHFIKCVQLDVAMI